MMIQGNIEARLMWQLLFLETGEVLKEPSSDYSGLLEGMEAADLLALIMEARKRLGELGVAYPSAGETSNLLTDEADPVRLFIDSKYTIRMGGLEGPVLPLRPLVKALFILFLRHPEGILLKQRDLYRKELEDIYAVINPNTAVEDIKSRVGRLVDLQDNSFSEKASVLNARLEELFPKGSAENYKIQGNNGHPRKIPLDPLLVEWA